MRPGVVRGTRAKARLPVIEERPGSAVFWPPHQRRYRERRDAGVPRPGSAAGPTEAAAGAVGCPNPWPTPGPPSSSRASATSISTPSTSSCRRGSAATETVCLSTGARASGRPGPQGSGISVDDDAQHPSHVGDCRRRRSSGCRRGHRSAASRSASSSTAVGTPEQPPRSRGTRGCRRRTHGGRRPAVADAPSAPARGDMPARYDPDHQSSSHV